jgi:hypothetical protein
MRRKTRLGKGRLNKKSKRMLSIEFSINGKDFQLIKSGSYGRMHNHFINSVDMREQLYDNPKAKFRLVENNNVVGLMKFNKRKKGIETIVESD